MPLGLSLAANIESRESFGKSSSSPLTHDDDCIEFGPHERDICPFVFLSPFNICKNLIGWQVSSRSRQLIFDNLVVNSCKL